MTGTQAQSTNLLDAYLQHTAAINVAASPKKQSEAPAADAAHNPSQEQLLAGKIVLQNVHQALDEVLEAAHHHPSSTGGQKQPSYAAVGQQQAGQQLLQNSVATGMSGKERSNGVKGLFRAMRQADAAAIYAARFQQDQEEHGQMQQTVVMQPADGSTAAVRMIANQAAMQAKLQRLQSDMDAKSYRQELLQQLQYPDALFQQQQEQQGRMQHQVRSLSTAIHQDSSTTLHRPGSQGGGVFHALGQYGSTLRPATSPASVNGVHTISTAHTPSYSCAATAATTTRSNSSRRNVMPHTHLNSSAAAQIHTPGRPQMSNEQQQQYRFLQQLVDYEPPWKPSQGSAAAAGLGTSSTSRGCVYPSQPAAAAAASQQRPYTSAGLAAADTRHCKNSNGSSKLQGLRVTQRQQTALGSSTRNSSVQLQHQQQQRMPSQRDQRVQRPASAVAALEQSLSELVLLKSKYSSLQQQQQVAQQMPQPTHTYYYETLLQPQPQLQHPHTTVQVQYQTGRSSTWLPEPSMQHFHEAIEADIGSFAADVAGVGLARSSRQYGFAHAQPNSSPGLGLPAAVSQQQGCARYGCGRTRHQNMPYHTGYDIWDDWQQLVHSQPPAMAPLRQDHYSSSYNTARASQLQRAKSAPRPLRAWDVVPLPITPKASLHTRRYSSSGGSPGKLTGHLQQLRQQQLQRPKTAAPAFTNAVQPVQSRTGYSVRPLGPHNHQTTARFPQRGNGSDDKATAVASALGSHAVSTGWLQSSPLQRAQKLAASSGSASKLGGAAGRARAVAAALSGMHTSTVAAAACSNTVGNATAASVSTGAQGSAAASAVQLLQKMKSGSVAGAASGRAAKRSPSKEYSDRLAAAVGAARGVTAAGGSASLTRQMLQYAAGQNHSGKAQHGSFSSSGSSSSDSDDSNVPAGPGKRSMQTAYAAALARVRAASRAATLARRGADSSDGDD